MCSEQLKLGIFYSKVVFHGIYWILYSKTLGVSLQYSISYFPCDYVAVSCAFMRDHTSLAQEKIKTQNLKCGFYWILSYNQKVKIHMLKDHKLGTHCSTNTVVREMPSILTTHLKPQSDLGLSLSVHKHIPFHSFHNQVQNTFHK